MCLKWENFCKFSFFCKKVKLFSIFGCHVHLVSHAESVLQYSRIIGSWSPPLFPLLKGEGRTFQKLSHLGGSKIFGRRRDNPEKWCWCRNVKVVVGGWRGGGWLPLFFVTLRFNYIYCMCVGRVKFPLLCSHSSVFLVDHTKLSSKSL